MATASLSYNGSTVLLTDADVWEEGIDAAPSDRRLAMQRGSYLPSTLEGPRRVRVTGLIGDADGDEDVARSTLEDLSQALAVEEPQWLYLWTGRRIKAVRERFSHSYVDALPWAIRIDISFFCPDPIWQDTTPSILCTSGGASGSYGTVGTFAITRTGTAPTYPLFRFIMNHKDNAVVSWVYYGPNLLTNTRFDQGESATQAGVPVDWVGDWYGVVGLTMSFAPPMAMLSVGDSAGAGRRVALHQDIPLTEIGTVISGQADINIVKEDGTGGTAIVRIEFLNAGGALLAATNSTGLTDSGCDWYTVVVHNVTAPAGTAWIRFLVRLDGNVGGEISIGIRNCAITRAATASFPGHHLNQSFTISHAGDWQWGDIFEVDNEQKTVRFLEGNDWENAWPFFGGNQDFFAMPGSTLPLHFAYTFDHSIRYQIDYRETYWNA